MRQLTLCSILILMTCLIAGTVCAAEPAAKGSPMSEAKAEKLATIGGGCYWCTEAVFQRLEGVTKVESGFSGGTIPDPSYEAVCTGSTGHAEVIQITYDPSKVAFEKLLEVFFKTHDPTTLNRQGADHGTQYRSVIFYHDDAQKAAAEKVKAALDASGAFSDKIVTEIAPYKTFYRADDHHQNYYNQNQRQGYCQMVIAPKVEKFEKAFKDILKK